MLRYLLAVAALGVYATEQAKVVVQSGGRLEVGAGGVLTIGSSAPTAEVATIDTLLATLGVSTVEMMASQTTLSWSGLGLDDEDCEMVASILTENGAFFNATTLDLSNNAISDACADNLALALSAGALPELTVINVEDTHIGAEGLQTLTDSPFVSIESGIVTSSARRLSLADNPLTLHASFTTTEAIPFFDDVTNKTRGRLNRALSKLTSLRVKPRADRPLPLRTLTLHKHGRRQSCQYPFAVR